MTVAAELASTQERPAVPAVILQHVEDAAVTHAARAALVKAPHVRLRHLRRFDDRVLAHLDGVSIAGDAGWRVCEEALEAASADAVFVAAVLAVSERREDRIDRLLVLAESEPEMFIGVKRALGWVEAPALSGIVQKLLSSGDPFRLGVGIAASAMHRVDPGIVTARLCEHPDPQVRARSLRTAGELGRRELLSASQAAGGDESPDCSFWGSWSAVILGSRANALASLAAVAFEPGPQQLRALRLVLLASEVDRAHAELQPHVSDPAKLRLVVRGTGYVGDSKYIPWLISHMADDKLARLAGESFSMITGLDLAWLDLERKPPMDLETGPNDEPEDDDVAMDEDDGLPWPDQAKVQAWWNQNGARFTTGVRHFMGAPPSRAHCIDVLKNGFQRQRIAAAHHLCLLNPGTPLFEWRAPAWRQQSALARIA